LTGRSNFAERGAVHKIRIQLKVNGEDRECLAPVHHTLLEVLREELGLMGTKHGCELGECGTCTVLVDGHPILSCLALPVECGDRELTTLTAETPKFRAFDKKTGELVWEKELSGTAAAPMTYMYGGKQYIVLAVGGGNNAELIAYALR